MDTTKPPIATMAQQVAQVAKDLQRQRTGHAPKAVTVVLSEDTLVITLHGALSPAEQALSKSREGAAQVQEFHRQLFRKLCRFAAEGNQENHRPRGARGGRRSRSGDGKHRPRIYNRDDGAGVSPRRDRSDRDSCFN